MNNKLSASLILGIALVSGCSFLSTSQHDGSSSQGWLRDGTLAMSRPVPPPASRPQDDTLLGFIPSEHSKPGRILRIDRRTRRIELRDGGTIIQTLTGDGLQALKPGVFSVIHKQKSPVWYAPDVYFTTRLLNVPAAGQAERFRRGALGEYAIFLDSQTPLHSGPVWREEIGGVKIDESEMARLFEIIDVGTRIEVR